MPEPHIEFYNQAVDAVQSGQLPEALQAIENSLTEAPKDAQSWQLYAVILNALGRKEDAAKALVKVQEMGLSEVDALLMQAAEAAGEGKMARAITLYEDALELDDSRAEIHTSYALALLDQDYKKDALDAATRGVELAPDDASAHYALGRVLRLSAQKDLALKAFEKSTSLPHPPIIAQYEYGMLLAEKGELQAALDCFETFLATHPDDPNALKARENLKAALEGRS
ncbi:MAG: tetratricopeptide repeat protein [Verrucomicrobiales bacterium]